jgi:hypothetical protein
MSGQLFCEHGPLSAQLTELEQFTNRLIDEMPEEELLGG